MKSLPVGDRRGVHPCLLAATLLLLACGGPGDAPLNPASGPADPSVQVVPEVRVPGADVDTVISTADTLTVANVKASADDGNVPGNVLDGNLSTRWSCSGIGCWIRTDLSTQRSVTAISVAWYAGNLRSNSFTVSVSNDDSAYTQVFAGKSSGTTTALERYELPATTARYVKLTVNGNSLNTWASITELSVHGTTPSPSPAPTPTPAPFPNPVPGGLVGAWAFDGNGEGSLNGANTTSYNNVQYTAGKVGAAAATFNGSNYLAIPDSDALSPASHGQKITVAFWMNPATFNFTGESAGYVNFLGKGLPGQHEWTFRIYNSTAQDGGSRAKRVSFYAFNLTGGLGAGSYFQDDLNANEWIFVTGVIDGTNTHIYKNGVHRDSDPLSGYGIAMGNGTAPVRIGSRDGSSWFQGSVDMLRIYDRALSAAEVQQLYQADLAYRP